MTATGWTEPDKDGNVRYVLFGNVCCLRNTPPTREGFEVFFTACIGGTKVTWTYRPIQEKAAQ